MCQSIFIFIVIIYIKILITPFYNMLCNTALLDVCDAMQNHRLG